MFRRVKRVAILGCGPAGLFAAHRLHEQGNVVSILSKKRQSHLYGAQYLHRPIPGLGERATEIEYQLQGPAADYALKVYGSKVSVSEVSPSSLTGFSTVYDIRLAYQTAWDFYAGLIVDLDITPDQMIGILGSFDRVVSSIPAPALCAQPERHNFHAQQIWAIGDAPDRDQTCPISVTPGTVVCNALHHTGWYRASNIFGYKTAEWPEDRRPPIEGISKVLKPLRTDCDCWQDRGLIRVGRYGSWTKGVLSHQAYWDLPRL